MFEVKDSQFVTSFLLKNNPKTCVAVAITEQGIAVRNSNDESKNTIFFTKDEWGAFIKGVNNSEFDI